MKHYPDDDDDTSRSLWQHSPPFRYLSYLTILVALLMVMAILWQNNVVIWRPPPDIQAGSSPGPHLVVGTISPPVFPLDSFPESTQGWRDSLNPGGIIPDSGFDVWYLTTVPLEKIRSWPGDNDRLKIDPTSEFISDQDLAPIEDYIKLWRENPKNLIGQENTPNISIDYSWSDFKNIPSRFFGAYWTGWLEITEAGDYEFVAKEGYSSFRILLDRHVLQSYRRTNITFTEHGLKGGIQGAGTPRVKLEPGRYLLEVEYLNNWHSTDFTLDVNRVHDNGSGNTSPATAQPAAPEALNSGSLPAAVTALNLPPDTVLYVAAVYESENGRITVQAPPGDAPYALFLSSHQRVNWTVAGRAPVAVIHDNSGHIRGAGGAPTLKLQNEDPIAYNAYDDSLPVCQCNDAEIRCEPDEAHSLAGIASRTRQLTTLPLAGYSGIYRTAHFELQPLDKATHERINHALAAIAEKAAYCKKLPPKDIEHLMERPDNR